VDFCEYLQNSIDIIRGRIKDQPVFRMANDDYPLVIEAWTFKSDLETA
jgi:hypothetical protein